VRALVFAAVLFVLLVPSAGAWTWPVAGPVLSGFAFDPAHPYAAGEHRGIDIGSAPGTAVAAPAGGEVTFAGTVPSSGQSVTILTADGLSVTLTHLGSLAVAKGAAVAEGDRVGAVGPSGTAEQSVPYVHLGIRTAANEQGYLDPLSFLPAPPAPAHAPPPSASAPAPAPAAPAVQAAPPAPAASGASAAAAPVAAPPPAAPAPAAPAPAAPVAAAPAATPAAATPAAATPAAAPAVTAAPAPAAAVMPAAAAPVALPAPAPATLVVAAPAGPARGRVAAVVARPSAVVAPPRVTRRPVRDAAVLVPAHHVVRHTPAAPRSIGAPGAGAVVRPRVAIHRVRTPAVSASHPHRGGLPLVLPAALAAALAAVLALVRMILGPSSQREGARSAREDPGSAGVAVWQRPPAHRPRGGLRRAGGRVRALPPAQGRRRLDGERDGRARHAGDGGRRPERRVPA
jgi:hypothetical protein